MCPYKEHKFSVIGTKGSLIFDDTKNWSEKLLYNPSFVTSKNSIITAPIEKIKIQDLHQRVAGDKIYIKVYCVPKGGDKN